MGSTPGPWQSNPDGSFSRSSFRVPDPPESLSERCAQDVHYVHYACAGFMVGIVAARTPDDARRIRLMIEDVQLALDAMHSSASAAEERLMGNTDRQFRKEVL